MAHQPPVDRQALPARRTAWAWAVATVCGAGFLRPGPGTYGSVVAVLLWWGTAHLTGLVGWPLTLLTGIAAALATAVGIPAATRVARESGRDDPGFVVIDEVAGQWVALLGFAPSWKLALLGLLLFRAFDIAKPWPIRKLEALPEGTGILLDDLLAGAFALVLGHLLLHVSTIHTVLAA